MRTQRPARRTNRLSHLLESLEGRILLAADTWNGGAAGAWSVPGNWSAGVPAAGSDLVFNITAAVTVDVANPTVNSVTINAQPGADSNVTFSFINANATLTVNNDITLNTVSGHNAGISMLAANATVGGVTVSAVNLTVANPTISGTDTINVGADVVLSLSGNLDTNGHVTTLQDGGEISATGTVRVDGAPWPAAASTATVEGEISATAGLQIGGTGLVGLTVASTGTVDLVHGGAGVFNLGDESSLEDDGNITCSAANVGDIAGQAAGLGVYPASAVVSPTGQFGVTGIFAVLNLVGGTGTSFTVDGGYLSSRSTTVGPADGIIGGPTLSVVNSGTASAVAHLGRTVVGLGDLTHASGELIIGTGASADATTLDLHETRNAWLVQSNLLLDQGSLSAESISIGYEATLGGTLGARVEVDGTLAATGAGASINVGDGSILQPSIVNLKGPSIAGASEVHRGGLIRRTGPWLGNIATGGAGAGFLPGDGLIYNASGSLTFNPASTTPYGTLTIGGDLDASTGLTLDSVLGPYDPVSETGTANLLEVTGQITLGGSIASQFSITNLSAASIPVNASFPIMSDLTVVGNFTDYPLAYTGSGTLYSTGTSPGLWIPGSYFGLSDGSQWELDWDSSSGDFYLVEAAAGDYANATLVWDGDDGTAWQDANNWYVQGSSSSFHPVSPTSGNTVLFEGGTADVQLDANSAAHNMYVEDGANVSLDMNDNSLTLSGTSLTVTSNGDLAIYNSGTSSGLVTAGTIQLAPGTDDLGALSITGTYAQFASGTVLDAGLGSGAASTLSLTGGASFTGTFVPGGVHIIGDGNLVANWTSSGTTLTTLVPGTSSNSYATLTFSGNLDAAAGMTLDVNLNASGESNSVDVSGTLTLGGSIANQFSITNLSPYSITPGTTFNIMQGQMQTSSGPTLVSNFSDYPLHWTSGTSYTTGNVPGSYFGLSDSSVWSLGWNSSTDLFTLTEVSIPFNTLVYDGEGIGWNDPDSWFPLGFLPTFHPRAPLSTDTAIFTTYAWSLGFSSGATADNVIFENGTTVTLHSSDGTTLALLGTTKITGGSALTLSDAASIGGDLDIAPNVGDSGGLDVDHGTLTVDGTIYAGYNGGTSAAVYATDSILTVGGDFDLASTSGAPGTLTVGGPPSGALGIDDSILYIGGNLTAGSGTGAVGTVDVIDGSEINVSGVITMGCVASGTIGGSGILIVGSGSDVAGSELDLHFNSTLALYGGSTLICGDVNAGDGDSNTVIMDIEDSSVLSAGFVELYSASVAGDGTISGPVQSAGLSPGGSLTPGASGDLTGMMAVDGNVDFSYGVSFQSNMIVEEEIGYSNLGNWLDVSGAIGFIGTPVEDFNLTGTVLYGTPEVGTTIPVMVASDFYFSDLPYSYYGGGFSDYTFGDPLPSSIEAYLPDPGAGNSWALNMMPASVDEFGNLTLGYGSLYAMVLEDVHYGCFGMMMSRMGGLSVGVGDAAPSSGTSTPAPDSFDASILTDPSTGTDLGINLTWNLTDTSASAFEIQRQVNGGSWVTVRIAPAVVNEWLDTRVTAGNTYNYRIVALSSTDAADSGFTDIIAPIAYA